MSSRLRNYLRSFRKRLALSQAELAFLLGSVSGANVCRYESSGRDPGLRVILAYEMIFGRPAHEIFAGLYLDIERLVASRAKRLLSDLSGKPSTGRLQKKRNVLKSLSAGLSHPPPKK